MEDKIGFWSDFMKNQYHPRSLMFLNPPVQADGMAGSFDTFADGLNLLRSNPALHDNLTDKIRRQIEDCDQLQGFQLFVDGNTGFSGMADQIVAELRDDGFPKHPVLLFDITGPKTYSDVDELTGYPTEASMHHIANQVFATASAAEYSIHYIPIGAEAVQQLQLQGVNVDIRRPYSLGAAIASAIDTAMLPFRLNDTAQRMHVSLAHLEHVLSPVSAMRVLQLEASLPFPVFSPADLSGNFQKGGFLAPRSSAPRDPRDPSQRSAQSTASGSSGPVPTRLPFPLTDLTVISACAEQFDMSPAAAERDFDNLDEDDRPESSDEDSDETRRVRASHALSQRRNHFFGVSGTMRGHFGNAQTADQIRARMRDYLGVRASIAEFFADPLYVPIPYPQFFSDSFAPEGLLQDIRPNMPRAAAVKVPVFTALSTNRSIGKHLMHLRHRAKPVDLRKLTAFALADLNRDSLNDACEVICSMAETYLEEN
eukprot:comp19048_c0_seq2/m.35250 comp19048_c0_seq2/g.35250  ORF comp19048_c0_seq2/g.35250 comp19048_c0_seq2/m.35250 type:complete len:483 (-) comp19048_c0_seq2:55-1503(-)